MYSILIDKCKFYFSTKVLTFLCLGNSSSPIKLNYQFKLKSADEVFLHNLQKNHRILYTLDGIYLEILLEELLFENGVNRYQMRLTSQTISKSAESGYS